ncbi:hypothetical protein LGV68_21250 [Vibrio sp. LQ2]|uniref:hypothetical protein n=1 Tax=Vibrio sp. LQ2 TaxID=2883075 RepID=UPI00208FB6CA|nr:hypothetical protein [Vibrio sp. LQ2]USP05722.1 hypothetical protein LGV68_21250 [Vibrio sp. LQ2]
MSTFTLLGLLVLIVGYGAGQYCKLLKWKRALQAWQHEKDQGMYKVYLKQVELESWERDLTHREKVWNEFKEKVNKDLKWNWKI